MSSAVAGTLRIKSPYEFGAHHAGPVACELMVRYPDLTIRIDVEHEIVNPVAENYDIVFAMLEAPLPSTGIVIRRVSSLERGLYAAPSLLEKFGEPRTLEELAWLPMLTGPNDAPWALTTPAGVTEHLAVQKARLVSSNADIRLQAALAGHGVLRVTASFTKAAEEAGSLRRILTDHVCEPLNIHALLPARQFVPAKVRCFLDALDAHGRGSRSTTVVQGGVGGNHPEIFREPLFLAASNPNTLLLVEPSCARPTYRKSRPSTPAIPNWCGGRWPATRRRSAPSCRRTTAGSIGSPAASCATTARPRTWCRKPMSAPSRIWKVFAAIPACRPGCRGSP